MRTSKNTMGIDNDPTKLSAARRRIVAAGLALAILTVAAGAPHVTMPARRRPLRWASAPISRPNSDASTDRK
jgi:hypothetical protein